MANFTILLRKLILLWFTTPLPPGIEKILMDKMNFRFELYSNQELKIPHGQLGFQIWVQWFTRPLPPLPWNLQKSQGHVGLQIWVWLFTTHPLPQHWKTPHGQVKFQICKNINDMITHETPYVYHLPLVHSVSSFNILHSR